MWWNPYPGNGKISFWVTVKKKIRAVHGTIDIYPILFILIVFFVHSHVRTTCKHTTYMSLIARALVLKAVRARKSSALGAMMKGKWWTMADFQLN